jgi:hypothetical protein
MNRFDQAVREAKEAMVSAGQLPRQIMPDRQLLETDDFFLDIYFSATNGGEWVGKITYKNEEDRGLSEELRAPSRDALIVALMRQNADLKIEEQELQAPPLSKIKMPLSDYASPEDMVTDAIQSGAARQWLLTPVGQQYSQLEKVCSNSCVFEIWKRSMEELGYWENPTLWTVPNLDHAFILGFDRGDYSYFEKKAERRDAEAAEAECANSAVNAEFKEDAESPFLHINTASPQSKEIKVDRDLPLSDLRRKAYAQRFANRQSR